MGTPWPEVIAALGEPELYEPPSAHAPGLARHHALEIALWDDVVAVISLQLDADPLVLPPALELGPHDLRPDVVEVDALLEAHGVTWRRLDALCTDLDDLFRTERGVHLSFRGDVLGKGAADPARYGSGRGPPDPAPRTWTEHGSGPSAGGRRRWTLDLAA